MKKCIFVVGLVGSGSTHIAKVISGALGNKSNWNGRGFNCCNDAFCDEESDFLLPHKPVKELVCHRSFPFGNKWPDVAGWIKQYDCYFVICTRDRTISEKSRVLKHNRTIVEARKQTGKARELIKYIINSDQKYFMWSYETFMLLEDEYLRLLFGFLGIKKENTKLHLRDANLKYIKPIRELIK
jgi:hypothetical protein